MKNTPTRFIALLTLTMLFGSCIKENLADCNLNLSVELSMQGNNCGIEPVYSSLGKVTVFAFNEAGIFQDQFTHEHVKSGSSTNFPLSLPQGNYTLIAWAGYANTPFSVQKLVKGHTSLNELYMPSYSLGNGNKVAAYRPIFTGIVKHVNAQDGLVQKIKLQEITKPVQVSFAGLPLGHNYQARISFNAVRYKFENSLLSLLADDHYTMASLLYTEARNKYTTETSLLWPIVNYSPQLIIRDLDVGTDIFRADIKAMLAQLGQVNFDCEPVIKIDLSSNQAYPTEVNILINGWMVQYTNNEL